MDNSCGALAMKWGDETADENEVMNTDVHAGRTGKPGGPALESWFDGRLTSATHACRPPITTVAKPI